MNDGYQCNPDVSHFWGQYSPFFSVDTDINVEVPDGCSITFAQVLSRHAARDPTASKTKTYNATIQKIQKNVKEFSGKYAFLKDFKYTLGADLLTTFGQQEMVNSGEKYFGRYRSLARKANLFVRASGQQRVIDSAEYFLDGFYKAKNGGNRTEYPETLLTISEDSGFNNTLSHSLCTAFEDGAVSTIGDSAQTTWANIFVPPIQTRINRDLAGANLTQAEVTYLMDICAFVTVADPLGKPSSFCSLFTKKEFRQYDYYESLGKYYGYGNGNPLGPTQGVGFANELIARMTDSAVIDHTSTNSTLDSNNVTFPLGRKLYADFSHDNDITPILSVLGIYNSTAPLSTTSLQSTDKTNGYSAAWTVPFASRAYFEKMQCSNKKEELVRIIVNDRVVPLHTCKGDRLGRCTLSAFVDSLSFARSGGKWAECFE